MKKKGYGKLLSQLMVFVRPHKTVFYLSVIFDLLAIILNMLIPTFSGMAIDAMIEIGKVDFYLLYRSVIIILIFTITSSIFDWLGSHYMNVLTYKTGQSIRNSIYLKLNSVPIKYIDNTPHGDIMNTMINDVENVTDGFLSGFKSIVCGVFQILTIMVLMLILNWSLALIVIVVAPFSLIVALNINKRSKKLYHARVQTQGMLSGYTKEKITSMKIIKAFNDE